MHLLLDVGGLVAVIGEVADLANGAIYYLEDDMINAGLSAASAIPFVGWAATGAKFVGKVVVTTAGTKAILIVAKGTDNVAAMARLLEKKFEIIYENGVTLLKDKFGKIVATGDAVQIFAKNIAKGMPDGFLPALKKTVSRQKQAKYVNGTPEYIQSGNNKSYFNSQDEAQSILDAVHSSKAEFLRTSPQGNQVFKYEGVTGFNNNPGAGYLDQPTNVFIIKGTSSPSVVPTSPL